MRIRSWAIRTALTRRRIGAALALVIAAGVALEIARGPSSAPPRSANAPASSSTTATVQRRDLVQTNAEPGTLGYANPQTVYNRLGGTITWLPPVGRVIESGQALFRVGSQPVILMNGSTPAYRDLAPADSTGQDLLQLNRNLIALGFDPDRIVADDVWQQATTAGVDLLQGALGETRTGTLTLGQIVFLPGDQIVSSVSAQLGSQASLRSRGSRPEFVALVKRAGASPRTDTTTGPDPRTRRAPGQRRPGDHMSQTKLAGLIELLRAETARLEAQVARLRAQQPTSGPPDNGGSPTSGGGNPPHAASPSPVNANGGGGNPGGGSATAILQTSSTRLVATVELDPTDQSEARMGERAAIEMPSGKTVAGRISSISPVAQPSSNNAGSPGAGANNAGGSGNSSTTIQVTVTLRARPAAGLDQAAVTVNFTQARASHVLAVPVTALLARAGGGYAVQTAAAPHALIPVSTGMFAAGYVQISGAGIHPGLQVTDSQG